MVQHEGVVAGEGDVERGRVVDGEGAQGGVGAQGVEEREVAVGGRGDAVEEEAGDAAVGCHARGEGGEARVAEPDVGEVEGGEGAVGGEHVLEAGGGEGGEVAAAGAEGEGEVEGGERDVVGQQREELAEPGVHGVKVLQPRGGALEGLDAVEAQRVKQLVGFNRLCSVGSLRFRNPILHFLFLF